jgi:hypothetical protein
LFRRSAGRSLEPSHGGPSRQLLVGECDSESSQMTAEAGRMLKRTVQATLLGYVVLGLLTRTLERARLYHRCECYPDCWCKKPVLTEFRWVVPYGHKGPWNA